MGKFSKILFFSVFMLSTAMVMGMNNGEEEEGEGNLVTTRAHTPTGTGEDAKDLVLTDKPKIDKTPHLTQQEIEALMALMNNSDALAKACTPEEVSSLK